MQKRIALALISLLLLAQPGFAADPAAPPTKPGPHAEEFNRLHKQMKDLLAKMIELRTKHSTASEAQRTEILAQWKDLIAQGDQLAPKLIEAAKKAYVEAPNADKELARFLIIQLTEMVQRDEFEQAADIGKILMENNCPDKTVPNLAGIAAFAVSDFDAAEKYLDEAAKQGYYHSLKKEDKIGQLGLTLLGQLPNYKKLWAREKTIRQREAKDDNLPRVLLKTTKGDIVLELFEDQAPNTVANFINLVERGFYSNRDIPFHRVLEHFMAQGGDPTGTGSGGPGWSIACECYQPNHRNHFRGSISMAHAGRDTGGSQFFLTFMPTSHLDGRHTVFGRVISGMDVLAKLQRRDPDDAEAPRPDKIIEAKVLRKRLHDYTPTVL